jgi:hypothetical protein
MECGPVVVTVEGCLDGIEPLTAAARHADDTLAFTWGSRPDGRDLDGRNGREAERNESSRDDWQTHRMQGVSPPTGARTRFARIRHEGALVKGWSGELWGRYTRKGPEGVALEPLRLKNPGSDLLSHAPTHAVPSAETGLTSVFGMGTGVTLLL